MRMIYADAIITALLYNEEHEETQEAKMSIADFLDSHTVEGCPQNGGWISVKDRLPDKNGQYLCWFGNNIVVKGAAIATYLEMWKAFGSLASLETYPNVTHWMPIEPPKEDANGNMDV